MYKANGLNFKSKKDYVKGTADIEWEMFRNEVSDGNRETMPSKEQFVKIVYDSLMSGMSNGVWSSIDNEGTSGSAPVPDEIRFLSERNIKAAIAEFWEEQDDKPVEEAAEDHDSEKNVIIEVVADLYGVEKKRTFDSEKEARKYIKNGKAFDSDIKFVLRIVTQEVF